MNNGPMKKEFMKTHLIITLLLACSAQVQAGAGMQMPGTLHHLNLKQFEVQSEGARVAHLEAWHGDELNKVTWSTKWYEIDNESLGEISLGYVAAINPFWDTGPVVAFEREDDGFDTEQETWVGWQFKGTAPYFIHVDTKALIAKDEQVKVVLELTHEFALSKHWLLETKLELEAGSFNDHKRENEVESWHLGWRFQYETVERFRYYIGVEYSDSHTPESQEWRTVGGLAYWW